MFFKNLVVLDFLSLVASVLFYAVFLVSEWVSSRAVQRVDTGPSPPAGFFSEV